jgi:transcriptional regulator with XRE-family HTH domain
MKTIYERISKVVYDSGLMQQDFARSIGVTSRTLFTYIQGKSKVSSEALEAICRNYKINANWLLLGDGEMYMDAEKVVQTKESNRQEEKDPEVAKLLAQIESMQKTIDTLLATNQRLVEGVVK